MTIATIRKQLHNYLDIADKRKLQAIYTMLEDDIIRAEGNYTAAEKAEFNRRALHYLSGGKMVSPEEMKERIKKARKKRGNGL